jgi:hypothetical protein
MFSIGSAAATARLALVLKFDRTWRADAEPALKYLPKVRARLLALVPLAAVVLALVPAAAAWQLAHQATPIQSVLIVPFLTWSSVTAVVLVVTAREGLRRRVVARAVASALRHARPVELRALGDVADGALVRVRGRVRAGAGLPDHPLVVAERRCHLRSLRRSVFAQVRERACEFRLTAAGREVELALDTATLAPLPHVPSWQLRDGEEVEIIGAKATLVHALGDGPYRGTRERLGLAAPGDRPLLVMPLSRA